LILPRHWRDGVTRLVTPDKSCPSGKKCRYDPPVEPEERHRNCWYGRRTAQLPEHLGSHTIVDGELVYCAHPMYWPVVRYEFDLRNCEDCDVFKARRTERPPES
jgi:hypothetical protein